MPNLYLSPSMQEYNKYVGGGNEEYYMNLLADDLVPYLIASGISYTRNDPNTQTLSQVIQQSNAGQFDLHLALHSNAAGEGKEGTVRGVEVYYNPQNEWSKKAAEFVAQEMKKIYPDPSLVKILPTDTLAEVLKVNAPSVLVEVGYHDNEQDAQWIRSNLPEIAGALAKAVTAYFGIPCVAPQIIRRATVHTGGANLHLRKFPSTQSESLALMPNGSKVIVYSQIGNGWSVVGYCGKIGYAASEYLI